MVEVVTGKFEPFATKLGLPWTGVPESLRHPDEDAIVREARDGDVGLDAAALVAKLGVDDGADRAIEVVVTAQTASVSLLQRRLRVGYTRAGRLIDMLERRNIISPYEGSKPRRVLITEHELERVATVSGD